jgi:phytol kinase
VIGVVAMLLALGGWLALIRLWQHLAHPHPEWARKLLHIGVGMVGFGFPFVIASRIPVWIVCILAASTMLALRLWKPLKTGLGGVLSSVNRVSLGEFYFLLGLPALFTLSQGGALYGTALAILTFADAAAALVGTFHGKHRFGRDKEAKSLEGSLTFFGVSFFICAIGLNVNGVPFLESGLAALVVSAMMALLEAVARDGLDNLLLPICTYLLLRALVGLDAGALAVACLAAFVIVAGVAPWRNIRRSWAHAAD